MRVALAADPTPGRPNAPLGRPQLSGPPRGRPNPGGAVGQSSVFGKLISTRRFFFRPASVELSAMGKSSP
jgi:hypothetical protein